MSLALVTGGAGFFGQQLSEALIARGYRVRVLDIQEIYDPKFRDAVEFVQGDICDAEVVRRVMEGVDVVYHNAAVLPIAKAGKRYHDINVGGTRTVLAAAKEAGVRRAIYISSSAVYGIPLELPLTETSPFRPFEDYGISKRQAEEVCEEFRAGGMNVSIVRPRTIVGPGRLGIFSILFDWIREGRSIYVVGSGDNIFQFLDSRDLLDACVRLAERGDNEDFNIGASEYGTFREALEDLVQYAGTKSRVRSINATLSRWSLRLLDKLGLSPLVPWHYETLDKPFYFDISKAERLLGWKPEYSNTRMLRTTYDWYLEHRDDEGARYGQTHNRSLKQQVLGLLKKVS